MNSSRYMLISLIVALSVFSGDVSGRKFHRANDNAYCESWKSTVESNDAGKWSTVPLRCKKYVKSYMTGRRYLFDSNLVAYDSILYAKNVTIKSDGLDCWVFDIDETLLSNLPWYADHGYGTEAFNETSFDEWEEKATAPALPASLRLYNQLKKLNFTIFLLTGRTESFRSITEKNLVFAGYKHWHKLMLRGKSDEGKTALVYKSSKRVELEAQGYRIHGSSGDQWSDLLGNATAVRSFKLPNPLYYIA